MLRQTREKKGLSLVDVENATKIRVRYIQALETEHYELIPGEVYRVGFLKNYARLLELDTEAVIAGYRSATKSPSLVPPPNEGRELPRRRTEAVLGRPLGTRSKLDARRRRPLRQSGSVDKRPGINWMGMITQAGSAFENRRLLLGTAGVIILILLIVAGAGLIRHNHLAAKQPAPHAANPPAVPSVVYTPQIPPELEIRLVGTGHCWVEVKVDGNAAYEGAFNPGDTKVFDAHSSIWLDLGYPESVDVYYNGNKLPPLGTTIPVTRTFTRNMGV